MFLRNALPEFAMHTEWRSYGPANSFSIPLCFSDPDGDISSSGTLTPKKVQMIIDSLKGTQSSLNMGDENDESLQMGESRASGCNGKVSHVALGVKQKSAAAGVRSQKVNVEGLKFEVQSQDSDSDDSVDRGIEEAIQEYLKEKDDHKQTTKLNSSPLQMSKQLRKSFSPSEMANFSDGNKILTASNCVPKSLKASFSIAAEKKRVQKEKRDANKPSFKRMEVSKAQAMKSTADLSVRCKNIPRPLGGKEEVETPESSSDNGIEEAIYFQMEKKKKRRDSKKSSKVFQAKEDSDSSSDDGIEEAIRHFQMEKQKEKCESATKAFKPSQPKLVQGGKNVALSLCESSSHPFKKQKVSPKRKRHEKFSKSTVPLTLPASQNLNTQLDSHDIRGNEVSLFKTKPLLPIQTTLKVNTTAELMCAEAILDISKAVMPRAFDHASSLSNSCIQPSPLPAEHRPNWSDDKSGNSSVDSDDGIEQEIRKFLESKAQMHKQQLVDMKCERKQVANVLQQQIDPSQNKKVKPSFAQKRRRKEEYTKAARGAGADRKVKGQAPLTQCEKLFSAQAAGSTSEGSVTVDVTTTGTVKNSGQKYSSANQYNMKGTECNEGIFQLCSVKKEISHSSEWAGKRGTSEDKSSSLDSDEDLDAAIKDLLKTKRKFKKKTRDKKVKSRKREYSGLSCEEGCEKKKILLENRSGTNPKTFKSSVLKNCSEMSRHASSGTRKADKVNSKPQILDKKEKPLGQVGKMSGDKSGDAEEHVGVEKFSGATPVADDSSSVDSDDSIEQEIRRFLAEKARVSGVRTNTDEVDNACATAARSGEVEPQQAEISPAGEGAVLPDVAQASTAEQHQRAEGELLRISPSHVFSESSKGHQMGMAKDGVKMLSRSRMSVEDDSSACNPRPDLEKCKTNLTDSHFGSNTEHGHMNEMDPAAETEVFQNQNLFHCNLLSPLRDNDTCVTSKSSVVDRCQDNSSLYTEDASSKECPLAGGCENIGLQKQTSPCTFDPKLAVSGPQSPKPIPACLPDRHYQQEPIKDSLWDRTGTGAMSEKGAAKESGAFPDPAAPHDSLVQAGTRDVGGVADGDVWAVGSEGGTREKGVHTREGGLGGIHESNPESCDDKINANEQSEQISQHSRL